MNDENMLVLGKEANLDVGYSPNLGAILLHLAHQENHAQGDIVCGGVITMLANSLGLNYNQLHPIEGDAAVDQEGPEPEKVDEEELVTDEEEEQPQQENYATYANLMWISAVSRALLMI